MPVASIVAMRQMFRIIIKRSTAERRWPAFSLWKLIVSIHAKVVSRVGAEVSYKLWFPAEMPSGLEKSTSQALGANWGLAFQGPLTDIAGVNYFLDLVSVLRAQHPDIPIVYTTSEFKQAPLFVSQLAGMGVEVVEIPDPGEITGHSTSKNLLRQISSCWHGLSYLKTVGVETAVRARTDQKWDLNRLIVGFSAISRLVDGQSEGNSRIFGSSLNTFKRRPFGVSDMLLVGDIGQLISFFKPCDVESYLEHRSAVLERFTFLSPFEVDAPEIFLGARFMASLALESHEDPVALFWERYFGILPATFISHSWQRQQPWQHGSSHLWDRPQSLRSLIGGEMTFEEWLIVVGLGA